MKIKRNEKALRALEKKCGVKERWSEVFRVFLTVKARLFEKKKSELLLKLHSMASERCFLVELKRKYADDQAIAIKLSKQIDKIVNSINKTLLEVNGFVPANEQIFYEDATDPKSSLYSHGIRTEGTSVPAFLKRQIIDLSCLKIRCEEEMSMVKDEMKRLVSFIHNQTRLIDGIIDSPDIPAHGGLTACLKKKRIIYSNQVCSLVRLWSGIWDAPIPEVKLVKTYDCLSGIDHNSAEDNSEEENDLMLVDEKDENFVLELSSDSDLSDDE